MRLLNADFNDETSGVCHVVFCPVVSGVMDVVWQRFTDIRAGPETAMKQRQGGVWGGSVEEE